MSLSTSFVVDTTLIQDGQAAGSITPADIRVLNDSLAGLPIYGTNQVGSFTTTLDMRGSMVLVNSGSQATATIPLNATVAYPIGTMLHFRPIGAGMVLLAKTGVATLSSSSGTLTSRVTGSWITAHLIAVDTWWADGDLT